MISSRSGCPLDSGGERLDHVQCVELDMVGAAIPAQPQDRHGKARSVEAMCCCQVMGEQKQPATAGRGCAL